MTDWLNWQTPEETAGAIGVEAPRYLPPPPLGPPPPVASGPGPGRAAMAIALVVAVLVGFLGVSVAVNRQRGDTPSATGVVPFTAPPTSTAIAPSADPGSDTASIAAKVESAVVDITTSIGYGNGNAAGTGMVITGSGEVLTNHHVIAGATAITVQINGQGPTYTAKVLGTDRTDDIAVLQIQGAATSNLKTVKAGNPAALAVGDRIVALGNALGRGGPLAVREGTVAALDQTATASDPSTGTSETLSGLIQTTAPLQPGDSGGPLVNTAGQVVGINTAASLRGRFNSTTGISFAIPITKALSIAGDIRAGRASATVQIGQPGFLGVQVGRDLTVTRVVAGMPAEGAGLQTGDTIVSVDGRSLATPAALTDALAVHRAGETVTLAWLDQGGRSQSAKLKLVAGPPS